MDKWLDRGVSFTILKIRFREGPMGFIQKILLKVFGKRLDDTMENHGISKTKVAMVVAILLPAIEQLSVVLGHPVHVPAGIKEALMAMGLWALKDGIDGPKVPIA